ncbi:MAG: hypothetical protein KUG73_08510 [Pseudomonadales bacterium]|nr:hypothetical protein [Pseudomonadales bacterium]
MKTFQKIVILTIAALFTASCSRVLWIPLSQTSNQRASAIKHLDALENEADRSSKRKIVTADGNDFNTKAISFAMLFESSDGFNGGVRSWGGAQAFDQEVRERYKIHDKLEWSGYIFENKFVHHMYYLVGDGNHMISYYSSRKYDSDFLLLKKHGIHTDI